MGHWGLEQLSLCASWGCSGSRSGLRDRSREPPEDSAAVQSRGLGTEPRRSTAPAGRAGKSPGERMFQDR